jgi:hypothetical protein
MGEAKSAPKQTRAQAPACVLPLPLRVVGVRVPPDAFQHRTPRVVVDVALGPVEMTFTVAARKKSGLLVQAPLAADGTNAIRFPSDLASQVEALVAQAARDDAAAAVVLSRRHLR